MVKHQANVTAKHLIKRTSRSSLKAWSGFFAGLIAISLFYPTPASTQAVPRHIQNLDVAQQPVGRGYYRIQLKTNGKYLDAKYCSDEVGLNPGSTYADGACQLWKLVPAGGGYYRLQLKTNGKYLDAKYCSDEVGLNPGSTYADGACQLWKFVPAPVKIDS